MRWIDEPKAGEEAEHPAPVFKLAPQAGDTNQAATHDSAAASVTATSLAD